MMVLACLSSLKSLQSNSWNSIHMMLNYNPCIFSSASAPVGRSPPKASKGTPGDAKCVTEILGGGETKIKKLTGGQNVPFCLREYKRIKLVKQSNKCVDVYV